MKFSNPWKSPISFVLFSKSKKIIDKKFSKQPPVRDWGLFTKTAYTQKYLNRALSPHSINLGGKLQWQVSN